MLGGEEIRLSIILVLILNSCGTHISPCADENSGQVEGNDFLKKKFNHVINQVHTKFSLF